MHWTRIALCAFAVAACSAQNGTRTDNPAPATAVSAHNELTPRERQEGWRLLFDGATTTGWRNYGAPALRPGWQAVDGAFTRVGSGGDIITVDQFDDFELTLDWMVKERGNSGVFFNVVEAEGAIYRGAPEVQILDDERHADGKSELTSAGSNYGLHPAPRGVVNPAGQWNSIRLIKRGDHVEHWLNGQKIVDYELGSADWKQRVANSKFNQWPEYGQARRGHIGLQDHGDWVAFRNIKIRVLR